MRRRRASPRTRSATSVRRTSERAAGSAYAWISGHHDNQFPHLWCAAPDGVQGELIASAPARYFRPPYVGHRGWVGVRLDGDADAGVRGGPDWAEVAEVCEDAYRAIAPQSLVTRLDV